jgi:hypothetical protein
MTDAQMDMLKSYGLIGALLIGGIAANFVAFSGAFGKPAPEEGPLLRMLGDPRMPAIVEPAPFVLFPEYPGERNARSRLDSRHAPTFVGYAAHLRARVSTACLPAPLKAALARVQAACEGFEVTSAARPGARVAGSGRTSLHSSCSAADFKVRVWACAFRVLASLRWRGSMSTDPTTVRCGGAHCPHIHVGWKPGSGEHGRRFVHNSTRTTRTARHYRTRVQVAYVQERGR